MVKKHVFKLGDRVKIIAGPHKGQFGSVVRAPKEDSCGIAIYLDEFGTNNHDCGGKTPIGHGWYEECEWVKLEYPRGSLDSILFSKDYKE